MSLAKIYTVMCDSCGHWSVSDYTARGARAAAKKAGFERVKGRQYAGRDNDGRDLCSKCAITHRSPT